jgi:FlaA1/EpsC-like NDP-sugar epimerase
MERVPRLMVWLVQLGIFVLSGLAAFLLRFDFIVPALYFKYFIWALPIWLIVKAVVFRICGLDRGWWRFVSIHDVFRIGAGNLLGSSASVVLIFTLAPRGFPRSLYILDFIICLLATNGVRIFTRIVQDSLHDGRVTAGEKAVLIYGAGAAGVTLLREIRSNAALHYRILGFVDDNPQKRGIVIHGTKVLGSGTALIRAQQIRDVAVEDLLGRNPVRLEEGQIRASSKAKSSWSRARRVHRLRTLPPDRTLPPRRDRGIRNRRIPAVRNRPRNAPGLPQVPFYPEIGSIQNRARLDEVLRQYSPSVIYHAAAYKHVPLMEAHVFEAIENNVFGTYNVAMAAAEHGVEDFVMISSDKAVRPTNVMGATKRIAELLLLALQNGRTKYVAVRFGNVLGSNGSVIPIFKKQIAAGGPVTVTHPDMRRFFMTIPEACQLVLQAAVIAGGRPDLRPGHGRAGQDRGSGPEPDSAVGAEAG